MLLKKNQPKPKSDVTISGIGFISEWAEPGTQGSGYSSGVLSAQQIHVMANIPECS